MGGGFLRMCLRTVMTGLTPITFNPHIPRREVIFYIDLIYKLFGLFLLLLLYNHYSTAGAAMPLVKFKNVPPPCVWHGNGGQRNHST